MGCVLSSEKKLGDGEADRSATVYPGVLDSLFFEFNDTKESPTYHKTMK